MFKNPFNQLSVASVSSAARKLAIRALSKTVVELYNGIQPTPEEQEKAQAKSNHHLPLLNALLTIVKLCQMGTYVVQELDTSKPENTKTLRAYLESIVNIAAEAEKAIDMIELNSKMDDADSHSNEEDDDNEEVTVETTEVVAVEPVAKQKGFIKQRVDEATFSDAVASFKTRSSQIKQYPLVIVDDEPTSED